MEQRTSIHLLGRYASEGSQAAFSQLVERYIKLVYTTCYRELGQKELAEDATQAVFLTLARKPRAIYSESALAPWLYTTARFEASVLRRKEQSRMARERLAAEEMAGYRDRAEDEAWIEIEPALNDAIGVLAPPDQQAILLRFFEQMSLREVGAAMGTNEEAAKKRVSRALGKLRAALLDRRAAAVSAVALAAILSERAACAVPANLSATVAQSAAGVLTHSSSFAPPASGGVATGRGGSLFRPLNPLLGKGLLIVSTTKIVAGAAVAVVLIFGLIFAVMHKLHSPPPLTTWQAPVASDPATQAAQQQIQTEIGHLAHSFATNNDSEMIAFLSPGFVVSDPSGHTQSYQEIVEDAQSHPSTRNPSGASSTFKVNTCSIQGNTAVVGAELLGHGLGKSISEQRVGGHIIRIETGYDKDLTCNVTLTNTSGQWLMSRMEMISLTRHPYRTTHTR